MSASPILEAILAPGGLSTVLQPILEIRGHGRRIFGLECLSRGPHGSNMEAAPVLFEYVRRKREEGTVDRACVAAALEVVRDLPAGPLVSLNVHATTLERDPEFVGFLADAAGSRSIALSRLTVDIVQSGEPWSPGLLQEAVDALRHVGIGVALDVGVGQQGIRRLVECQPEYLKVDGYVVRGCSRHFYRRAILESLVELAHKVGARVVAHGLEEQADFVTLASIGIALFQGNLLCPARPLEQLRRMDLWPERPAPARAC
jgi:EAL domain-containing protein (putative c-di-GMP-specific phosphodiesterase class I)